ncbi:ABC transporter ATP-binding protein [Bordetella genomosp. 13]|uniref:ABC transporter ATP-binding protein n=1 Tax=Bordetella genomosp. 13 TaxID=463040 RepID=UPI00119F6BBC|nr:ABC transporter ATP-binding protein [Bordetella genomosp. 13]
MNSHADTKVLEVENLAISDRHTGRVLVRGIQFSLARGGRLGIVGESGSGKSLTCKAILGILPDNLHVSAGRIRFDGHDVTHFSHEDWLPLRANRISAVFQDPGSYLNPSIPVGRQLAQVLRHRAGLPVQDIHARTLELFRQVGLRDPAQVHDRYPHELSGGMLQRIVIAIAVAAEPILLIADEATTALDVTVQAEVLDLISDLREQRALSLVFISHDLAVVSQVADHVIVMRDGAVVEAGPTHRVLSAPADSYTQLLIQDHLEYGLDKFLHQGA